MQKHLIIVGAGTAGVIVASLIKKCYGNNIQITIIYDKENESIGVGEGTTVVFNKFLHASGITGQQLIKNVDATFKQGIYFKSWAQENFFHGFVNGLYSNNIEQIRLPNGSEVNHTFYEMMNNFTCNSLSLYNKPSTDVLNIVNDKSAYHIDGVLFSKFVRKEIDHQVTFIEDKIVEVFCDKNHINALLLKNKGKITADFYIDCSGFAKLLFSHMEDSAWIDLSATLPINRALIHQVKIPENKELPAYTLAEATSNGWIWQIPTSTRYGTGYLYSSDFTSDEEAKADFNLWLNKNHNVDLATDRVIKFKPGYYKDFCLGNCAAIGLASGFIEPLEATGIISIITQTQFLLQNDVMLYNLDYDKNRASMQNRQSYEEIVNFVDLHYCTNRTDSNFWKYKTNNKSQIIKDLEEKCRNGFLTSNVLQPGKMFQLESYIQVAHGLGLFEEQNVKNVLFAFVDKQKLINKATENIFKSFKFKQTNRYVSHRNFLNELRSI